MASSPAGRTRIWARPPPRTAGAVPAAVPPDTVMSEASATPPKTDPSASPGSRAAAAARRGRSGVEHGAGDHGRHEGPRREGAPSSSTTTTSSGRPKPEPPCASGRCRPSQPSSAMSPQKAGSSSVSAVEQRPGGPSGIVLGQEVRGRLAQGSVVFGDGDRHGVTLHRDIGATPKARRARLLSDSGCVSDSAAQPPVGCSPRAMPLRPLLLGLPLGREGSSSYGIAPAPMSAAEPGSSSCS